MKHDFVGLDGVAGFFETAGGKQTFLGNEMGLIELADRGGFESHEAGILIEARLRHGREQLGVEEGAELAGHVVEHAIGDHGAVALSEDDVAFHVNLQRLVALLRGAAEAAGVDSPDDDPVGFDIDVAKWTKSLGQAVGTQALHDDVDAATDNRHFFALRRGECFEGGPQTFGSRPDFHAAEAGPRGNRWRDCGGRWAANWLRRRDPLRQHGGRQELRGLQR